MSADPHSAPQTDDPSGPAASPAGRLVPAIYADGAARPAEPLDLPDGTLVQLLVPLSLGRAAPPPARPWPARPLGAAGILSELTLGDAAALAAGLLLYAITRFVGLAAFPIYFFCDEAIQTTLARQLLANGLRGPDGTFLPPYFLNAEKWNLSLSVYIHLLGVALAGNSIVVTRTTSVAVTLLAALAVALTLRLAFQSRFWWAGPLALAATPAWFLHSRTAFETAMMVSFYACFLCCYLLYRTRGAGWLYPALVFGGMTFYAYANGQGVMLASGVLLLLSDLRYHLRQGSSLLLGALGLLLILVVPLARFRTLQPGAYAEQLRALDSYWMRPLPLGEKLATFGQNYLAGLSPAYWFLPNDVDLVRHRMQGMGHLPLLLAIPVLLGLIVCLARLRSPIYRALLIAVLAAPFSAALVDISITRVLSMVVPASILAVLGLDRAAVWLAGRVRHGVLAAAVALILGASSLLMLRSALADGPTWFSDYGLGGMQYGARQIFAEAVPGLLARDPDDRLLISPTWANNPNSFLDFFLSPEQSGRVELINIDAFTIARRDLDPSRQLFIMPDYEYVRAQQSGKFVIDPPERIIAYPDGRPGFYVVRMRYVDNVDALFAADRAARARLVEDPADLGGPLTVAHSLLDIGSVREIFDGDPNTLMRGFESNPLVIELRFPEPRQLAGVALTVGTMDFRLRLVGLPADGGPELTAEQDYSGLPPDPTVQLDLPGGPRPLRSLRLEIWQAGGGDVAHIHVRELALR